MPNRLIGYGATLLTLQGCVAFENSIDTTSTYVEGETLYLSGTMNTRTYDEIERVLENHPYLTRIEIGYIDGSIDDDLTLQTGLMIHEAGLDTHLTADSFIESGGVDIFCAGHERTAERGAHIGVHAWAYNDGTKSGYDLPRNDPDHAVYVDYFEVVGCPVDFYWYTLAAAPPDAIHVMTEREAIAQGIVTRFVN